MVISHLLYFIIINIIIIINPCSSGINKQYVYTYVPNKLYYYNNEGCEFVTLTYFFSLL